MSQGVPAVVVPFNSDQKINAWLIKKHGVGIPMAPPGLTPGRLRLAVEKAAKDSDIKKNVQRFQALLKGVDGPKNAAKEIMNFLDTHVNRGID
jgi:UDP:flavonoid glycosyltransferase YjiC (YdhE family)